MLLLMSVVAVAAEPVALSTDELYDRFKQQFEAGQYEEALPFAQGVLAAGRVQVGDHHHTLINSVYNVGLTLKNLERYEDALPLYEQMLTIQRAHLGDDNAAVASSLQDVGMLRYKLADYAGAKAAFEEALATLRRQLGDDHPSVANAMDSLAVVLDELEDDEAAVALHEQSLAIRQEAHGPRSLEVAQSLFNLSYLVCDAGDCERGREMLEASLDIRREALGEGSADVADTINNLAMMAQTEGDYDEALSLVEEALSIMRTAVGDEHPRVAYLLTNKASLLRIQGQYAAADIVFQESLRITRRVLGEDHPDVARSLSDLATLRREQGDYFTALELYEQALDIRRAAFGDDHPAVAFSLYRMAFLQGEMGEYAAARANYDRSLAIREAAYGPEHVTVADSLHGMGGLVQKQGDLAGAQVLFEKSHALYKKLHPPDHPVLVKSLNNLASVREGLGDFEGAESIYQEALVILRATYGDGHPTIGMLLNNLANMHRIREDFAQAQTLFESALEIFRSVHSERHPYVAKNLGNLANVKCAQGDLAGARRDYLESLSILGDTYGPQHSYVAENKHALALVLYDMGDVDEARELMDEVLANRTSALDLLGALSDREGGAYLEVLVAGLNDWLWLHDRPEDAARAWTHVVRWKGAGTRSLAQRTAVARMASDDSRAAWVGLGTVRQTLARLVYAEQAPEGAHARRDQIEELTEEKERLERALGGDNRSVSSASIEDLCAALPADGALIDFVRHSVDSPMYLALVVRPDCSVSRVELGSADELDAMVEGWRETIAQGDPRAPDRANRVAAALWAPLRPYLDAVDRLWIVPDGGLSVVPWSALPIGGGRFLVESIETRVLSTARQLLAPEDAVGRGMLTVGGADYGPPRPSADSPCMTRDYPALPATLVESRGLEAWWSRRRRSTVVALRGVAATEAALIEAAPGTRLVHLATHGFFASGDCSDSVDAGGWNPMLRSGLVLAGANRERSPTDPQDGILTAEEIAGLDLRGTELVLLSACETALGDTSRSGEGVLGLQRGFSLAGAQAVVMSLWAVPDVETAALMQTLVSRVGKRRTLSAAGALRDAQLELLNDNRKQFGEPLPHTWAAWIVSR